MRDDEKKTLRALARRLEEEQQRDLFTTPDWASGVPAAPGVYVLWERVSACPIYVGETADLRARMRDLGRFDNHICRRKLAKQLRIERGNEADLSAAIAKTHSLSYLEVRFGRVELEEYLRVRWAKSLLNSPARRHRLLYSWVTPEDCRADSRARGSREAVG